MPTTVITLSEALASLPPAAGALDADDKVVSVEDGEAVQSPAADLGGGTDTIFTSSQPGLAPASGGGITNFLRADAQWGVPPGGTGGGITAEDALDAVAAAFNAGTHVNVTFTHNDAANSYTLNASGGGASTEDAVDAVAAALAAGTHTNITVTYNDASNTLSLAVTGMQPLDADLTTLAGLTATTNNIIQSVSGNWASRTPAQVKTALALDNVDNTTDITKPLFTTTVRGLVPPPGAVTNEYLRDDGTWAPAIHVGTTPPTEDVVWFDESDTSGTGGSPGGGGGVSDHWTWAMLTSKTNIAPAGTWRPSWLDTGLAERTPLPAGWSIGGTGNTELSLPPGIYAFNPVWYVSGGDDMWSVGIYVQSMRTTTLAGTDMTPYWAEGVRAGGGAGVVALTDDPSTMYAEVTRAAGPAGTEQFYMVLDITRLGSIPA